MSRRPPPTNAPWVSEADLRECAWQITLLVCAYFPNKHAAFSSRFDHAHLFPESTELRERRGARQRRLLGKRRKAPCREMSYDLRRQLPFITKPSYTRVRNACPDGTEDLHSRRRSCDAALGRVRATRFTKFLALHSLSASPTEIPERFSSSLLPPSFAAGRCAATFLPRPAVLRGRPDCSLLLSGAQRLGA